MTESALFGWPKIYDDLNILMQCVFGFATEADIYPFFCKKDSDVEFSLAYIIFLLEVTHIHVCKLDVMKEI